MFKNIKTIIIALLAIAIVAGCKGPPRPGFHGPRYNPEAKMEKKIDRSLEKEAKRINRKLD